MAAGCQLQLPRLLGNFLQLCGFIITNHYLESGLLPPLHYTRLSLTPTASLTVVSIFTTYRYFVWLSYSVKKLLSSKQAGTGESSYKDTMVTSRGHAGHF